MLEEAKLTNLKKTLMEYATLVESMVDQSITGLKVKKQEILHDVIQLDEPRANTYEIELDEKCVSIIAQHQPTGKALRTIIMILHINSTLERIGDHAVTIAESGLFLIERPPVKSLIDIPRMADVVKSMISDSITSFINEDSELAAACASATALWTACGLRSSESSSPSWYQTPPPSSGRRRS